MRFAVRGVLASLLASSAAVAQIDWKAEEAKRRALVALSPDEISRTMITTSGSDPLDPVQWISSQNFDQNSGQTDYFLRAARSRSTGEITYQIYISRVGRTWFHPGEVSFERKDGAGTAKLDRLSADVRCSRNSCDHFEDAVAEIDRPTLDWAARGAKAGTQYGWRFKIFDSTTEGESHSFLQTEIAGFLLAVDRAFDLPPPPKVRLEDELGVTFKP